MGDTDTGVFVRPDIPQFMKEHFLNGLADMTKPNQFELELLSGRKMRSRQEAVDTARELFTDKGCRVTFVTSLLTPDVLAGTVETLAVTKDDAWVVRTPLVERKPTPNGQGDTFSSVALGTYLKTKSAKDALEAAVNTLYGLVSHMDSGALDLPLIDEQRQILSPNIVSKLFAASQNFHRSKSFHLGGFFFASVVRLSRASEHRLLPIIKTLCFVRRIMSVAVFPLGPLETNC